MKNVKNVKMIVMSIATVTLAGVVVFVGSKLIANSDSPAITTTPTPEVSVEPTVVPTVSPEITVSPEATAKPNVSAEPTISPSAKPTATPSVKPSAKPSAVPTVKPTVAPTPVPTVKPTPVPTPTPKPVLCAADGANPDLPCDALVGNYEGADKIFEGDDANMSACKAWGYSINPDDYPGLRSYFCTQMRRNDRGIWGSAGMLVY